MTDLLVLVADSQMAGVVSAVLDRPEALDIRGPTYRVIVHPGKAPAPEPGPPRSCRTRSRRTWPYAFRVLVPVRS